MLFSALHKNIFGEHADMEKIAGKYPYFSAAHFFLLQQTKSTDDHYNDIAAKTALHFANPYLLQQQLTAEEIHFAEDDDRSIGNNIEAIESTVTIPEEAIAEDNFEHRVEVTEEPVIEENVVVDVPRVEVMEEAKKEEPAKAASQGHPPLLFEPLHTTDYFASQGIRLSEVVLSGDKMGRQLKSFTEWLKTMKKVHPEGFKEKGDGFIDTSVQKLAEKSNLEEEVVTESMAAVYIQQGRINKAKEIYEKLSLLNPSKNAYFAAKLKEIQ